MSAVVGRIFKNQIASTETLEELTHLYSRLPFQAEPKTRTFQNGGGEVVFFDYGAAQDFEEITLASSTTDSNDPNLKIFAQGEVTQHAREWLVNLLLAPEKALNPIDHPEAIIAFSVGQDGVNLITGTPGTEPFLLCETETEIVFANHQCLIGHWIPDGKALSTEALAWSIHKYHDQGYGHFISGITRTRAGSRTVISRGEIKTISVDPKTSELYSPISTETVPVLLEEAADSISDYIFRNSAPKQLALSGGKDSRAILGLLGERVYGRWINFQTAGEIYAPDVMAAQEVLKIAKLEKHHYIGIPPLVAAPSDIVPRISNDLFSDFALTSLADLRPVSQRRTMQLGGHEFGTKQSLQHESRIEFLERERKTFDVSFLLSPEGRETLKNDYLSQLEEAIAGVPDSKLTVASRVSFRLPTIIAATLSSTNVAATEFHPFLDYRFLRIVMGVDNSVTAAQGLHYILNRRFPKAIETAPFANDTWPKAVFGFADSFGLPFRGVPRAPFRFYKAFPSQSSFGRYNWRIDLFERMRDGVLEYLHDGDFDDSLIDRSAMINLVSKDASDWYFTNYYQLGSILKFVLINELGSSVLDSRKRPMVERTIRDLLTKKSAKKSPVDSSELLQNAKDEALGKAQRAIRDLALELQTRETQALGMPAAKDLYECLVNGEVSISTFNKLFSRELNIRQLEVLDPASNDSTVRGKVTFSKDGMAVISGFLLRPSDHLVLIRLDGQEDSEVEGLTWSDAGFWYFYISEKRDTGLFSKPIRWRELAGKTVDYEVRIWRGARPVYFGIVG